MKITARRLLAAAVLTALAATPFLMRPDPEVTGGAAHQHVTAMAMRPDPGTVTGGFGRQGEPDYDGG